MGTYVFSVSSWQKLHWSLDINLNGGRVTKETIEILAYGMRTLLLLVNGSITFSMLYIRFH